MKQDTTIPKKGRVDRMDKIQEVGQNRPLVNEVMTQWMVIQMMKLENYVILKTTIITFTFC